MILWVLTLFCFGLVFGSFINVVALRYNPSKFLFSGKILGGRSRCPHCSRNLCWYELVPLLSYIRQKGKCRECCGRISWQYPAAEILTGLVFLLPVYFYQFFNINNHLLMGDLIVWYYWFSAVWVLAALLMILLSLIDLRLLIIPDETVIGIGLMGLLAAALKTYYQDLIGWQSSFLENYSLMVDLPGGVFVEHLLAGLIGFLFFGAIFVLTKGRGMGFGDVKLAGAIGLLLGSPDSFLSFGLAFIIGSIFSLLMLFRQKIGFKQPIPFGPYLVISVFVVMFFGNDLADFYFSLFGIF